jgi:hypothetical protein
VTNAIIAELKRLARLGSPDAIAADLKRRRCKGIPGYGAGCVLVNRLRAVAKVPVEIDAGQVYAGDRVYSLPAAVGKFTDAFDSGRYPRLVEDRTP